MAVKIGGFDMKTIRVGTGTEAVTPKRIMLGTGSGAVEIWTDVPPFGTGRLVKVGNQTIAANEWTRVRDWKAEGPLTVEDGGIRVPLGVSVAVSARLDLIGQGTYNTTQSMRVMNGAVQLGSASRSFSVTGPFGPNVSFTGTGDMLTLEAFCNQASNDRHIVRSETTTIQITIQ